MLRKEVLSVSFDLRFFFFVLTEKLPLAEMAASTRNFRLSQVDINKTVSAKFIFMKRGQQYLVGLLCNPMPFSFKTV